MTTQYTTNRILNAANFSCVNMCVDEQWGESQLARSDFHAMHRYHDSIEIEREKKLCLRGIVTFLFVCFLSFSSSFHFTALQQFFGLLFDFVVWRNCVVYVKRVLNVLQINNLYSNVILKEKETFVPHKIHIRFFCVWFHSYTHTYHRYTPSTLDCDK